MAVTAMRLSLRPLSLNGRKVVATIMALNHKRLKMSENASCFEKTTSITPFSFNLSTSNFSEIVKSPGFVDKTLMLKEVLYGADMKLISAPRRFAKSTNMDMVKKFIEIEVDEAGVVVNREESTNRKIFKDNNLIIFQDQTFFDQHFATYPVMRINFSGVNVNSYDKILNSFSSILRNTYLEHKYLLKSQIWSKYDINIDAFKRYYDSELCKTLDEEDIRTGFQFLAECLYYHFNKKVFVLIDEFDAPINNTLFEKDIDINRVNALLSNIFLTTLKYNDFVERALLTGISYFATVGLLAANNIKKYMFLGNHPFVEYYCLTDPEVDNLMCKFKIDDETRNKVKSYYNGYRTRKNEKLYSLWSVLSYLETKELRSYWEESGMISDLKKVFHFPIIQITIEKLLKNESKKIEIFHKIQLHHIVELQNIIFGQTDKEITRPDLFLNFLLQQGYLTYTGTESSVRIPNKAICDEFTEELTRYYGRCLNKVFEECSAAFNQISVSDNKSFQKFVETFQNVVNDVSPSIFTQNERIFHSLLFSVICRSQARVCDDAKFVETDNRPDLIAENSKNGYVFEMKFRQDSKKALQQIIEKKYYKKLDEFKDLEYRVYVGVNLSEDLRVSVAVLVNNLDINKAVYFTC